MNLHILNAPSLGAFTDAIRQGFTDAGVTTNANLQAEATLVQIHGSPAAREVDLKLIAGVEAIDGPLAILIHRPDEVLMDPQIMRFFEQLKSTRFIFLGDLIFRSSFWQERRQSSTVICHPFVDGSMPERTDKCIVGAYTSWGDLRDPEHYFGLVEHLKSADGFQFCIGGSGLLKKDIPSHINYLEKPFRPHFNVQLYNLRGKKRYGESSGSLHRGISIPVIFEANGAERLEKVRMIKIDADDELRFIDYAKAASEIVAYARSGLDETLAANENAARLNSPRAFAEAVMRCLDCNPFTK